MPSAEQNLAGFLVLTLVFLGGTLFGMWLEGRSRPIDDGELDCPGRPDCDHD